MILIYGAIDFSVVTYVSWKAVHFYVDETVISGLCALAASQLCQLQPVQNANTS